MGVTKEDIWSLVRAEELVWEALIGYLEFCPVMFDVVTVKGAE